MHKSAGKFTKPISFRCHAPHAHQVAIIVRSVKGGPADTEIMRKAVDGCWHVTLELERGRYLYHFVVDGRPTLDPASRGSMPDDHGNMNSIREVGY